MGIPRSMWFSMVTYATVGYGQMVPVTLLGRVCACGVMLTGLVIFAMPIAVLAGNFHQVWEEHREEKKILEKSEVFIKK